MILQIVVFIWMSLDLITAIGVQIYAHFVGMDKTWYLGITLLNQLLILNRLGKVHIKKLGVELTGLLWIFMFFLTLIFTFAFVSSFFK